MPLITYKDLVGGIAAFNSAFFIRMRPTHGDSEPTDAVTIRLDKKRIHTSSTIGELTSQLQSSVALVELTTPVGKSVWINAERLENLISAVPGIHHPEAKSVLTLHVQNGPAIDQQVRETVEDVRDAFGA